MFTKKLEDQFSADLLNTVKGVLDEAKKCPKDCECEKCEKEDDEDEKDEMKEEKRGLWANIHAKRKRIKAGSGERMRKPGSEGAPTDADFKAASEEVEIEEVEQIDELSKKTLGSYVTKAARSAGSNVAGAVATGMANGNKEDQRTMGRNYAKRLKGIDSAAKKLAKEDQDFIDALNNDLLDEAEKNLTGLPKSTAEKNKQYIEVTHLLGHKKKVPVHPTNAYKALNRYRNDPSTKSARIVSEDVELEEGRGRPPKEGTPAWHARQKQANDDMVALGMQLRKAKSMNKKVRFMDGKEHEVSSHHADKFEDHMAARKTSQEKAAFQKQAHKSHADFVKAVSAPVPHASKDTGEIVKYRH